VDICVEHSPVAVQGFLDNSPPHSSRLAMSWKEFRPVLLWRPVAVPSDPPAGVVGFLEGLEALPQFLDGLEVPHPEQVFLEDAHETLGDAVALGLAHVGRRVLDSEEGDLPLEVLRDELAAVVMAQGQPGRHILAERPEASAHALPDRLQGFEPGPAPGGMDAHQFQGAVIDGEKYRGVAFRKSHGRGHVRAPHLVHALGSDRPVVRLGP